MKYDFKKLTIKTQLIILLVIFVVLAVANFVVLHHFIDDVDKTREKVALTQELPTHTKSLTESAIAVTSSDETAKKKISQAATKVNRSLELLKEGGKLPNYEFYVDPVTGENKRYLKQVSILWDSVMTSANILRFEPYTIDTTIQETIEVPLNDSLNTVETQVVDKVVTKDNPKVIKAKAFVAERSEDLQERMNVLVEAIASNHTLAEELLNYVILGVVALNFIIFCIIVLGIYKTILEPVGQLGDITTKLNDGHFDVKSEFEWKNEISFIADKMNILAAHLENATDFVKEVGKGELDKDFEGIDTETINENSLEAALLNMRDQMKKVEEEEEVRTWSTGGLAKFVDILRSSNDNVNELSDKIISNLVDYTESNQGGLYLLNDDDEQNKHLELISLYAFNTKKYDKQSYRLGEGLVGQTFLERKTTYLLEIPHEYITISSGLGGANPKAILLVPLQVNQEIFGILELASFKEYKDYEIEFVEKLGESIASTIASVKNNQRTKRLLEESQELTEQMQAQEEEMRQNMEELSATQEEMARKEIEMTAQLTAIDNSFGTAEYDINGLIMNSNAIFDNELGYATGDLYEKSIDIIYADEKAVWSGLKAGKSQSGIYTFKTKANSHVQLQTTFTPIKNDEGEIYKVIQFITRFDAAVEDKQAADQWPEVETLEATLRQNLESLEVTQQALDNKLIQASQKLALADKWIKIVTLDSDLAIKEVNPAITAIAGFKNDQVKEQPVADFFEGNWQEVIAEKEETAVISYTDINSQKVTKTASLVYENKDDDQLKSIFLIWV